MGKIAEIKLLFKDNLGKIVSICLGVGLCIFSVQLVTNFLGEVERKEQISSKSKELEFRTAKKFHKEKVTLYEKVIEAVKKPVDYLSLYERNFFITYKEEIKQVKEEAVICWSCRTQLSPNTSICPVCGEIQRNVDQDKDGMPDYWESKYGFNPLNPEDADLDKDEDGYSNLEEYRYDTDPLAAESNPKTLGIMGRFLVQNIYRKPVKLKLMGYISLVDGITLQINWGGKTDFKKMGETIRGYKVLDFIKKIIPLETKQGLIKEVDESFAKIQKAGEEAVILEIKKIKIEKELYAKISDSETGKIYEVFVGKGFAKEYKVLDITSKEVIIQDKERQKYTLRTIS